MQDFGPNVRQKELTDDVLQASLGWNNLDKLTEKIQRFHEIGNAEDVSIFQCLESL